MRVHDAKLLLVDDDPGAIRALSRILSEYPDQRFATSGPEALRLAREVTPDLVLLDAEMPGMTGLDVCDAFKADPALAHVPVIFSTAHQSPLLEAAALNRGAVDFLTKPPVAAQVTARVRAQLRAHAALPARSAVAEDAEPQEPARILIVDDDATAIRVLRHALAGMGDFRFAKSGEDALDVARRYNPDLVLVDLQMPGFDGFDVCRALKADPALAAAPVVFVTRFGDPRNEGRAFELGAADFVVKPYAPVVMRARVRNLLDLKRRQDSERRALRDHWLRVGADHVAAIVRSASDAIVSHDAAGRVVLANAAACRMFDAPAGELVGSPISALMGEAWSSEHADDFGSLTLQRGRRPELQVEVAVSSLDIGDERMTTLILRDVSDRERLERETRARIDAEAVSRTKTLMLSSIAHEVGNPLNGILGFAQLMAADAAHPLASEQAARLDHVTASARHLQALMRDLSDLGALEAGRLAVSLDRVALTPRLQDAAGAMAAQAVEARVEVTLPELDTALAVQADAERLHQCLLNLLSNAIKYNRAGGWVRVEVEASGDDVAIRVRDNGLGLDPTQRSHLFEPFNRLGRQGVARGSGLGLVVTRQLVQAMRGRLEVDSEPGQGSLFTIVLPRALQHDRTAAEKTSASMALEP